MCTVGVELLNSEENLFVISRKTRENKRETRKNKTVRVSAKSRNSGKNQGNAFCLKNIREKSGNSTNSRDNQGNIRRIVSLFLQ